MTEIKEAIALVVKATDNIERCGYKCGHAKVYLIDAFAILRKLDEPCSTCGDKKLVPVPDMAHTYNPCPDCQEPAEKPQFGLFFYNK